MFGRTSTTRSTTSSAARFVIPAALSAVLRRVLRIVLWVVIVLLCIVAFVRTEWVVLVAVACALIAVPVLGLIAAFIASTRIRMHVSLPASAPKTDSVQVQLTVDNLSAMPLACLQVDLCVRNLLTAQLQNVTAWVALAPRGNAVVSFTLQSDVCGRMECSVVRVTAYDPFRLFSKQCLLPEEGESQRITLTPTLHDVQLRDIYAASPLSDTTVFSPYVKGSDLSEVFGLRDYEEGDELRRIHWKLSEKMDGLVVREPSLPLDNSLLLLWDKTIPLTGRAQSALTIKGEYGADAVDDAHAQAVDDDHVQAVDDDHAQAADSLAEIALALMEQLAQAGVGFEVASNDIPTGRCIRSFITDKADIYEALGHLLSSPVALSEESGLDAYVRLYGGLTCSRLLYVGYAHPLMPVSYAGTDALYFVCSGRGTGGKALKKAGGSAGSQAGGNAGSKIANSAGLNAKSAVGRAQDKDAGASLIRSNDGAEIRFSPGNAQAALELAGLM